MTQRALVKKYGFGTKQDDVLTFHHRMLFGTDPDPGVRERLGSLEPVKIVTALLSSPAAQLG